MSDDNYEAIDLKCCRICLTNKRPLCPLFRYKSAGNYAEMLTSIANVKVYINDGFPDTICARCCSSLEKAFLLKSTAERSDRKLRVRVNKANQSRPTKKIAFNSFTEIKTEIDTLSIKKEELDVEIEVLSNANGVMENPMDSMKGKDIVICDTVIRKVDISAVEEKKNYFLPSLSVDVTWKSVKKTDGKVNEEPTNMDTEYLDDDFFHDDSDDEYVPPVPKVKVKSKFKKPKLSEIKVFKDNKKYLANKPKKILVSKARHDMRVKSSSFTSQDSSEGGEKPNTLITCYPILRNGAKGPPVLLKRPKDATILKVHPNYKPRKPYDKSSKAVYYSDSGNRMNRVVKPIRPAVIKPREKHVCPVCGVLTYGLGNHLATHSEKKRFTCSQCPRSFAQKNNLLVHMKTHTGVKDHICEVCGAGFYSQKSLLRHNLIHKGERPFGCNLCNKRFIARCDLTRHLRIHSGYKPYKCNTCTMSFNAKHQLQNHERMHTGERPYTCQVCNVAFSYKVNLNNHVFKVHGINLKFKSIHTITEDILRKEHEMLNETRSAIIHIMPQMSSETVPQPAAHETIPSLSDMKIIGYP